MALRAASSLMSYTGPGGCNHSRPTTVGDDGMETADPDWVLECGPCEVSLIGHELWGPANEPAPLTADEVRLRDAQHADATRNLWAGLAQMPDHLAALALQNQATLALIGKALGVDLATGLPQIPAGALAPGALAAPATGGVIGAPPVQDAVPLRPPAELSPQQRAAATRAANKAAAAAAAAASDAS